VDCERKQEEESVKIDLNPVKQAIQKKIASRLRTAEAKLEVLKAQAEAAKASTGRKTINELRTRNRLIQRKLHALKKSGQGQWEEARGDLEAQVADFEKSVRGIASKVKGR
jgi:hypothetical protein